MDSIEGIRGEALEIEIINWVKYNPRKDYKKPWWFAFDNRMIESSQFFSFSAEEFKAWIYILSQASQRNSGKVCLSVEHAERVCGIKKKSLLIAVEKLKDLGCIGISVQGANEARTESVHNLYATNNTNNTEQNNTNIAPAPAVAPKGNTFIKAYCEKFKSRWGSNPVISGKRAGIANRITKDLGEKKALEYLDAYFSMPDSWVVKAKHPIEFFESKLNEISVFSNSGEYTTARQAQQEDSSASVATQLKRIREGKL